MLCQAVPSVPVGITRPLGGIPASVGRRAEYAVSCYTIMLFMPKWLSLRPRINRMLIAIGMSAGTAVMPIRRALEVI